MQRYDLFSSRWFMAMAFVLALAVAALLALVSGPVHAEPIPPAGRSPVYQTPYPTPPPLVNTSTGFEGPGLCNPDGDPNYQLNLGQAPGSNNLCFTVDTIDTAEQITLAYNPTGALDDAADRIDVTAPTGCALGDVTSSATGAGAGTTSTFPALQPLGNQVSHTASYRCTTASGTWQFCIINGDGVSGALNEFAVKVQNTSTSAFAYGRLASKDWGYTNNSYCPGCTFDYTVVANCGSEIHVPLDDYENMVNLRIYKADGGLAPGGSWYVRRNKPVTGWCRYAAWNGSQVVYNPDGDNCAGVQTTGVRAGQPHCMPYGDSSGCAVSPATWPVTIDAAAVSWLGSRMYQANQCNASSGAYDCIPGDNGILYGSTNEACDYESPGGDNETVNPASISSTDSGVVMDLVIDLQQVGCGPIRLKADAGTTGFNWEMGANCNGTIGAGGTDAFKVYFTGAGVMPTQAVAPKPELALKNDLTLLALEATSCTPGSSYTSQIQASVTAQNLSCGDATSAPVLFDVTAGSGLSDQTATVSSLLKFDETLVTANLGSITCVCNSPQTLAVTASIDPNDAITECSESAASGEPVCNPPAGSANSQSISSACNAIPLAVSLAGFYAQQVDGHVLVAWETVSELDNLGFNLWRGTSPEGPGVRLNDVLIPSQSPGSPGGFAYTWRDQRELAPGAIYYYWLEDVAVRGAATRHGPVSVDYSGPMAVTLSSLAASPAAGGALPLAGALLALLLPLAGAAWAERRRS